MRFLRKLNIWIAALATLFIPLATPVAAYAAAGDEIQQNLCAGANLDPNTNCDQGGITNQQAIDRISKLLRTVIRLFSIVVGVASVFMIIVGGLKYITSGGDSGNVSGAKNTILYAIIGIVVVALAQFMVRFVLTQIEQ